MTTIIQEPDSGFAELDALLVEVTPEADPMEELLQEALQEAAVEKHAKAARDRIKRGGQSAAQIAEDAERIRLWELAHSWTAVANVALFERHECMGCGKHQTIFRQLMSHEVHRTMKATERWVAVEAAKADLPNEVAVQKWEAPMCPACSPKMGYVFRNVKEWQG